MDSDTIGDERTIPAHAGSALGHIDQYELLKELGGGGFGTVYLAKDTVSGIEVAVKGLPLFVRNNREEMENIRSNFALVSRLTHTNIAKALVLHPAKEVVYVSEDVHKKLRVDSGDTLMVMDYAPGVTLSQWRRQFPDRKVPLEQALEITRQIASALDYAHELRVVHRDIKPANMMIETAEDGSVKVRVLDFGLAAEIRSSMGRVSREIHDTSGTRPYMAPEQWLGAKQGPATDQYSLAAMFCELVTGDVPFASVFDTGDPVVMMNAVGREPFAPSQDLPKPIRLALSKALAKRPEERFASCGDFVAALEGRGFSRKERKEAGGPRPVAAVKGLLAAAALGLAALGGWWWANGTNGRTGTSGFHVPSVSDGPSNGECRTLTLPGGVKMEMIYVASGSFMMGSPVTEDGHEDDETQHRVTLTKGYWLGKYEVTQRQWESVMGENPSRFKGSDRPVEQVSWEDCQRFIAKVDAAARQQFGGGARLPTEAEWEYACRAGTTTAYSWGNALNGDKANCDGNNPCGTAVKGRYRQETADVGSYSPNDWGFYDMIGNVWEWCGDWYGDYPYGSATDPTGAATGAYRVYRGGGWNSDARYCRSAYRIRIVPGFRNYDLGFRVALAPSH